MRCLALSELTNSQIDAMANELRKRIALFRITSHLDNLPATDSVPPQSGVTPGVVVAGDLSLETVS